MKIKIRNPDVKKYPVFVKGKEIEKKKKILFLEKGFDKLLAILENNARILESILHIKFSFS